MILYFTSKTCGPCKIFGPTVESLKSDGYKVHKVDVDSDPGTVTRFRVLSVPTLIVVDNNGTEIKRTVGAKTRQELINFIDGR